MATDRRWTIDVYNGEEQVHRLPRMLRFGNFRGHSQCVFSLDSDGVEYRQVANDQWVNESLKEGDATKWRKSFAS